MYIIVFYLFFGKLPTPYSWVLIKLGFDAVVFRV